MGNTGFKINIKKDCVILEGLGCGTVSLQNEKYFAFVFIEELQTHSWSVNEDERQLK